jgi:hypothetical protein
MYGCGVGNSIWGGPPNDIKIRGLIMVVLQYNKYDKIELPCQLCRWLILQALPLILEFFSCGSLILTWFLAFNVLGSMHVLADFVSSLIDSLGLLGLVMGLVGVKIIQTCMPTPYCIKTCKFF